GQLWLLTWHIGNQRLDEGAPEFAHPPFSPQKMIDLPPVEATNSSLPVGLAKQNKRSLNRSAWLRLSVSP
ncbi:MAG: hypothetical protein KKA11_16925, partial [Gammaproteobacteria bacterium]|nr:hypothetical protein [Gammaproteobacteria bacterium]